jgi:hypothetical protein
VSRSVRRQAVAWLLFAVFCCQIVGAMHVGHQHEDGSSPESCLVCSWAHDLAFSDESAPVLGLQETPELFRCEPLPVTHRSFSLRPFGPRAPPAVIL